MTQTNRQYTKLRKQFLNESSVCKAKIDKCSINATDIHHTKGRGKYHLDTSTWLAVCRNCHIWIENYPVHAKELGFSSDRI